MKPFKIFKIAVVALLVLLVVGMFLVNRTIVMPIQEKYELLEDSLTTYLGREVVLDSTPHILVSINVTRNEYLTDKGITVDYKFVDSYFKGRDTIKLDSQIVPEVDGTRISPNGNE